MIRTGTSRPLPHPSGAPLFVGVLAALFALSGGCDRGGPSQGGALERPGGAAGREPGAEGGAEGGGGQGACVSDRVAIPSGDNCRCECTDCLCSGIQCTCDGSCYGQTECLVNSDSSGNPSVGDGFGADCKSQSCVPEDDLTKELKCSFSDCKFAPNKLQLNPNVAPEELDLNRAVKNAGLIATIDTSSSMTDKQAYSACAADAFIRATQGAEWSIGVMTQDITQVPGYRTGNGSMPPLLQVSGACAPATSCTCGGSYRGQICDFAAGGAPVSSSDPNALDSLRKLMVQGSNEESDIDEAGLEKAFLYVMGLIRQGRGAEVSQVVVISDEDASSDAKVCSIQANRDVAGIRQVLGSTFNPPANTGNCTQDLTGFYSYFFTFVSVRVNALVDTTGRVKKGQIYMEVARATGGTIADLFQCSEFEKFWTDVGVTTTTLSTQLCFSGAFDPATAVLTYTESGANLEVPQSAADGWTYDAALGCVVLHGTWESRYGSYHVSYPGSSSRSGVCFPAGVDPIAETIKVSFKGSVVPKSATDGWTYDASSRCIVLHGSWSTSPGPFDVEYL